PLSAPFAGEGVSTQSGMKHVTAGWCPVDNRARFFAGDFNNAAPYGGASYQQTIWALDIATRFNDGVGARGAGWSLEYSYQGFEDYGGGWQPKHPDFGGFVWVA